MNKYRNKKIIQNGIEFDSKREARRFSELSLLEKAGAITNLQMQVKFELIPAQYETFERYGKNGKKLKDGKRCVEKSCVYVADFVYQENGKTVVEDVKGVRTKEYRLKKKMLLYFHGIRIKEV